MHQRAVYQSTSRIIAGSGAGFVDIMANDGPDPAGRMETAMESAPSTGRGEYSQETAYIPIRVLGRGAFGEAVLYRRVEVSDYFRAFVIAGSRIANMIAYVIEPAYERS